MRGQFLHSWCGVTEHMFPILYWYLRMIFGDGGDASTLLGALDSAFLFAYAIGMYFM